MHLRIATLVSLALVVTACGAKNDRDDDDRTPDAGQVDDTDAGQDAGDDHDAGQEPVDAGPEPCDAEPGASEACEGVGGGCTPGVRFCDDGFWSSCLGRQQPIPKLCDVPNCAGGLNDGCECLVGTTEPCYDGPEGTVGGAANCSRGFRTCEATEAGSAWGACQNQILPQAEDCSGRDLDCDEETGTDEDCACTNGEERDCGGQAGGTCAVGRQTCTGGKWGTCTGAIQPEPGDCEKESCLGGPNPGCQCVVGTDEPCYTGPFGTDGVGECVAGTRACVAPGVWSGTCVGQTSPFPTCDLPNCTGTPHASCQ